MKPDPTPHALLDAPAVAKLLVEIGQRLSLAGENPYKARSYSRAAQGLMSLTVPLEEVIASDRLREIPGVGPALAETIKHLHQHGTTPKLELMRAEFPAGLLALSRIPGLPPNKVVQLHRKLGIASIEELEQACRDERLAPVKGLGAALQKKVLDGIELMRWSQGRRLIHHAEDGLLATAANLSRSHPELRRIVPAGEFRRGCELVSDMAVVAETPEGGDTRVLNLNGAIQLWLAEAKRYGPALIFATGSAEHVRQLQALADEKGLHLEKGGLYRGKRLMPCNSEEAVFTALDLPSIPPELREGAGELELARAGQLPKLVSDKDIRGLLHCHTDFSDGGNTLEEMAEATRERGYQYFGVADHSQSAGYAGGLKLEDLEAQHAEADALNARYGGRFRVFKGIESDILQDGSLDYPDEVLDRFDFVVGSVHSRFRLDEKAQTERILRAVANPHTTILGHMTGRMLMHRPGYEVDIERVLRACAKHGVAVEINANPHRLDVDWRWHRRALEFGCMMSINPDAHSIEELDLTRWGVLMARKGEVPPDRVLNCLTLLELSEFLARRRVSRAAEGSPVEHGNLAEETSATVEDLN
jgi:DNA polymerase (family 10)